MFGIDRRIVPCAESDHAVIHAVGTRFDEVGGGLRGVDEVRVEHVELVPGVSGYISTECVSISRAGWLMEKKVGENVGGGQAKEQRSRGAEEQRDALPLHDLRGRILLIVVRLVVLVPVEARLDAVEEARLARPIPDKSG
jgi:hypothetical protein